MRVIRKFNLKQETENGKTEKYVICQQVKSIIHIKIKLSVFREMIRQELAVPFAFAPAHINKQRAAAIAALGMEYYREGKTQTAMEHVPDYLRVSQAERERAEKLKIENGENL